MPFRPTGDGPDAPVQPAIGAGERRGSAPPNAPTAVAPGRGPATPSTGAPAQGSAEVVRSAGCKPVRVRLPLPARWKVPLPASWRASRDCPALGAARTRSTTVNALGSRPRSASVVARVDGRDRTATAATAAAITVRVSQKLCRDGAHRFEDHSADGHQHGPPCGFVETHTSLSVRASTWKGDTGTEATLPMSRMACHGRINAGHDDG